MLTEIRSIKDILVSWALIFPGLAAATAVADQHDFYSRIWFVKFYIVGAAAISAHRLILAKMIRHWIKRDYVTHSVVVVNELAGSLIRLLEHNTLRIRGTGVFGDGPAPTGEFVRGVPALGNFDDLLDDTSHQSTDLVVVILPLSTTERLNQVVAKLRHQPLNVRVLPGELGLDRISPTLLARDELPGVQLIAVADRRISKFALFVKGSLDRIVAAVELVLISPILLAIAVGISMSSRGPILFPQERVGYNGRPFGIYEFRTMHMVAEGPQTRLTESDDKRGFKSRALLRKLSFDVLPQLVNVANGDMSLVGPRLHMPGARAAGKLYFEAVNEYAGRQRVKPGMTGWAQVYGWRRPTETL